MPPRVFSKFANRIAQMSGEVYPLHVGDTYLKPAKGARMEDLIGTKNLGLNRYTFPHGHPELISAVSEIHDIPASRIQICSGATAGLHCIASTFLEPGDEVIILAPYWPLIGGIVQLSGATAVSVPFFGSEGTVSERIAPYLTEKTVAIYMNTPNNPTGIALDESTVSEIAGIARDRNLWLWSDEVYDRILYRKKHVAAHEFAPERSFAVHSFSKSFGMAGNRCGYIIGPPDRVMGELRKAVVHSTYSTCTASQIAAANVLRSGQPWLDMALSAYKLAGEKAADMLGLPHPDGSTFLFMDIADQLDDRGLDGFLGDCIDRNLLLAPGSSFGAQYQTHIRICYTSAPPNKIERGVTILKELLDSRT